MMSSLKQCWRKTRRSSFINSQNLTKLMSSIKRILLFPLFFNLFDVVLDGNGIMLFDGPFLSQLLSVLMIVLSSELSMSVNLEISTRPSCSLLSLRDTLNIKESKNRVEVNEEVDRWDGESCVRLWKAARNEQRPSRLYSWEELHDY